MLCLFLVLSIFLFLFFISLFFSTVTMVNKVYYISDRFSVNLVDV